MKRFFYFLLLCLLASPVVTMARNPRSYGRVGFSGALTSSDTYSLEASYHQMFGSYIGIGGALGYWANYYEVGWASGPNWNIDSDDNKPSNFYLRPSIVLKSPGIRYHATRWSLYAEPGVMLNIPYRRVCIESTPDWPKTDYHYISTNKGQWAAVDLRIGVCATIGPCEVIAGYMMSNLDIYSQYRHLSYQGKSFKDFYPTKSFMQGAYITLTYNLSYYY